MKRPPKQFTVEKRVIKPTVQRRPETRIRTLREGEAPKQPPTKTETEWMQSEVAVYVSRLRMANDPGVVRHAAEKLARRDEAENAMASILALPNHPLGPGYFITARKGSFNILGQALKALFSLITFVKASKAVDIHSPSSLRPFIKSMRKGNDPE